MRVLHKKHHHDINSVNGDSMADVATTSLYKSSLLAPIDPSLCISFHTWDNNLADYRQLFWRYN